MNSLDLLIKKIITLDEFEEQLQLSVFNEICNFIKTAQIIRKPNKLVSITLN
jgi:hypothetical protein